MGETGFCENLWFSAVSCENLRFPAVFCENLPPPNPLICRASRKSAKICKNLRKCAFWVRFLPFAVSLLARPEISISMEHTPHSNPDVGTENCSNEMVAKTQRIFEGFMGHTPSTAGPFRKKFRKKFRKNSGKTPETLSERFLEFLSRVRLGSPKAYNSRHLRLPERFQNSPAPSTAGDASFFRSGSGEGLSELVMEFPAVLGVFLILEITSQGQK